MPRSLSPRGFSRKSKIDQISRLFRPEASHQEHTLADVISTLAKYAKHCLSPPRNKHDLKILLRVSIVLARAGKL
jgi:hypothetical protein